MLKKYNFFQKLMIQQITSYLSFLQKSMINLSIFKKKHIGKETITKILQ